MKLTDLDLRRQIKRLKAIYNTKKTDDELVEAWRWVLGDLEPHELMSAVSDYAKGGGRFFPVPGQIREHAVQKRPGAGNFESTDWNQLQEGPCPVCGAVMRLLTPKEQTFGGDYAEGEAQRYGVLHDLGMHTRAGEPAVGYWH